MKVLYVHHCSGAGGASNSMYHLLKELVKEDLDIHIVTPAGSVVELFKKITSNVYVLKNGSPPSIWSAPGIPYLGLKVILGYFRNRNANKEVITYFDKIKPDIVHLNDYGLFLLSKAAKKRNLPVVMHARCAPSKTHLLINQLSYRYINKYVDKLLCISGSVAARFKKTSEKNVVVYNSFPINDQFTIRQRKDNKFNCLFIANLLPFKGIFETIEAARLLKEETDIHFYIAGSNVRDQDFFSGFKGWFLDKFGFYPNVEKRVKQTIEKHKLKNVHLLGFVKDIEALIKTGHLNLAPMRLNAPPRSVIEVGVYGMPSVLALQDKIEDMVIDGVTGTIIPERNSKALAEAILALKNDEDLRYKLSKNSKEHFTLVNDPQKNGQLVREIYQKLLEGV